MKRAWWLWIIVGVILAVVVTASVLVGLGSPGDDSGRADGGASNSSEPGDPAAPGVYGTPSMPSDDPIDPWKGARPIVGVDAEAFKSAMAEKWKLDFRSRPVRGGVMQSGLAGDLGRQQRRLDGIVKSGANYATYQVMCQAGGANVTPTDETSMGFVYDCLNQVVRGQDWDRLKVWLDQNLPTMAKQGGDAWFKDLAGVRLYAESNGHILSCVLVNIP